MATYVLVYGATADGWHYRELSTRHEPEHSMPRELADLLLELA